MVVSLRADISREDPRKLVFLIYFYPFFYLSCEPIQDSVQLPFAEFFLRVVLVTRLLFLFFEDVTPSSSLIDFLRFLPMEPGS